MLFITLGKTKAGTFKERVARRAQWQYPPGIRLVAEYWLVGAEYSVVTIAEADTIVPIMAALSDWSDVFDFTVMPALTADEGLRLEQEAKAA